jgi:hypothetical protein
MSTWRRKAIESFPDLQHEFQKPDTTIYQVFFELLPRVRDAHERDDTEELQRIYGFARWCLQQRAKDIWNAAGVAFYEHLVDHRITRDQIPQWLPPDVFHECMGLFEARLDPDTFRELCERYSKRTGNRSDKIS